MGQNRTSCRVTSALLWALITKPQASFRHLTPTEGTAGVSSRMYCLTVLILGRQAVQNDCQHRLVQHFTLKGAASRRMARGTGLVKCSLLRHSLSSRSVTSQQPSDKEALVASFQQGCRCCEIGKSVLTSGFVLRNSLVDIFHIYGLSKNFRACVEDNGFVPQEMDSVASGGTKIICSFSFP